MQKEASHDGILQTAQNTNDRVIHLAVCGPRFAVLLSTNRFPGSCSTKSDSSRQRRNPEGLLDREVGFGRYDVDVVRLVRGETVKDLDLLVGKPLLASRRQRQGRS